MQNKLKIEYIEHLGSDIDVVSTSRVCTGLEFKKITNVKNNIRSLIRNGHWSVFDHQYIKYMIECPIYVARQWMRHQQAYMEKSLRYTTDVSLYSGGTSSGEQSLVDYQIALEAGTPPEDARGCLPLETMTRVQCTVSLRTALHMLNLRMDKHAQAETQHLAELFYVLLREYFPVSVEVFLEYIYQDFRTSVTDLRDIIYFMKKGALLGDSSYPAIRRFIENAEARIETVEKYLPAVPSKVEHNPEDSESNGDK